MACTITDYLYYYSNTLAPQALKAQTVLAIPAADFYRISIDSSYRILGQNPNITTAAYRFGIATLTDGTGSFTLTLPSSSAETHPTDPAAQWSILLPDGRVITGVVPDDTGPFTIDDLITTYDWHFNTAVYVAPVTAGQLARGTAVFVAASSADVVFAGVPFASATYTIQLTPSVDTDTGDLPAVGWGSKSTSGFTIKTSADFTGSIDWEAVL